MKRKNDETIALTNIATFSPTRWVSLTKCIASIIELSPEILEFFQNYPIDTTTDEDEDEDDFFIKSTDICSQTIQMEKNSHIIAEQLDALFDVTSFMKNVSSAFEKNQNFIVIRTWCILS